jgi:hypothetical protein
MYQTDMQIEGIAAHIPPVPDRCALDFVIGGFCGKCTASQIDSKFDSLLRSRGAHFHAPLYTKRAAVDRTPRPPQSAPIKEQP